MGKSWVEIQKAYRERQKLKGPVFLSKERARQRQNYVPASHLSKKKKEARNNQAKLRNRLSRLRKKTPENDVEETSGYGSMSMETGDDERNQPTEQRALIVKLPLTKKGAGAKKIIARALSRAHREIKSLKSEVIQLRKKIKIKNRKIDRINNKTESYASTSQLNSHELTCTPMKKTEAEVSRLNLTPRKIDRAKRASGKKKAKYLRNICTRLSRRSLRLIEDKTIGMSVEESVIDFLGKEDNCRIQPGKADAKKVNGHKEKKQTKSACDGLGGTTKRMADEAIRQGNVTIQDAADFYAWAFLYVSSDVTKTKRAVDETLGETEKEIQPGNDNDLPDTEDGAHGLEQTLTETEKSNEENIILNDIHINDLVAAVYEGRWYIGRVEKKDDEEGDYKLNFMQRAKQMFKWPPKKD
ncbi:hypothetical protein DPMN_015383 [Dreissena polymorpha]|uniref:Uncharacterized protein n=1 Tax=Dreissena polymorpha TaxID=45954 RepID=A0A9D4N921_DREPO|nr:hypothetical protein DPMN_015383 [Dreissena polymorpha]